MPRSEALCPQCFSLERHRLFQLLLDQGAADVLAGRRILHFAPEGFIRPLLEQMAQCVTTDVAGGGISCRSSMEALPFPDASFDAVIANHVLEHIADDRLAMREIRRVLRPDGLAILSVPLVQGWARTYEDRRISEPGARRVPFGQDDHLRYYGRDFVDRLRQGGFAVDVFQLDHRREIKYGLQRGEQMFIARPLPGSGGRKIRSPIPAAADD